MCNCAPPIPTGTGLWSSLVIVVLLLVGKVLEEVSSVWISQWLVIVVAT